MLVDTAGEGQTARTSTVEAPEVDLAERVHRLENEGREMRTSHHAANTEVWDAIHQLRQWQAGAVAREEARIETAQRLERSVTDMRRDTKELLQQFKDETSNTLKDIRENMVTKTEYSPVKTGLYLLCAAMITGAATFVWKVVLHQ